MFTLKQEYYAEEIKSRCFLYEHPTGLRLLHIQNEDKNKVFFAAFPTPCENDKGIPHIVEHCVLAGSKRYPIKDPFYELSKSSLHTYLNALTYRDKTVYPAAGVSSRDFRNLVEVYLDAVFCPLLRKETFFQEGWNKGRDGDEPGGIVYNEMSGVYSDPAEFMKSQARKLLFPNSPYRFDAGGVPEEILTLEYQEFLDFYREKYHPSRCFLYFYGDMDITDYLTYIDTVYLSSLSPRKEVVTGPAYIEKGFNRPVEKIIGYNFTSNPVEYLYGGKVMRSRGDFTKEQGIKMLLYYLLGMQASPLKRAVLDSGLGQEVKYLFHGGFLQPFYELILCNSKGEPSGLMETEENVIRSILHNGPDAELLEACFAKFDFGFRDYSGYRPKGLVLGLRILEGWLYEQETFEELLNRASPLLTLDKLKRKGTDYLLKLLETDFIGNYHAAYLKLVPKEAETIPFISLAERLREEPEAYKTEEIALEEKNIDGLKLLLHPMDTRGIIYMDVFFDVRALPEALIPGIGMVTYLLGKPGTEKFNGRELSRRLNAYFGGFAVDFEVLQGLKPGYHPKIVVKIKCLSKYLPEVLETLREILCNTLFKEEEIYRLLLELASKTRNQIVNEGQNKALIRLLSYFGDGGEYKERACGIAAFEFLEELLGSGDKSKCCEYLERVSKACISRSKAVINLTCEKEDYEAYKDSLRRFYESLPESQGKEAGFTANRNLYNEAFVTGSKVQYVTAARSFRDFDYKGTMPLAAHILNTALLTSEVRVAGGAYGSKCRFLTNGILYFYSYRDPHLQRTLEVYERALSFLADFRPDGNEMDKYKVGALNKYLRPKSNEEKGRLSASRYFIGITQADLERKRSELLEGEGEDIRKLGLILSESADRGCICVSGSEKVIGENSKLFNKIHVL